MCSRASLYGSLTTLDEPNTTARFPGYHQGPTRTPIPSVPDKPVPDKGQRGSADDIVDKELRCSYTPKCNQTIKTM
eukprot:3958887-Pyramimonas_sp.AAC.1